MMATVAVTIVAGLMAAAAAAAAAAAGAAAGATAIAMALVAAVVAALVVAAAAAAAAHYEEDRQIRYRAPAMVQSTLAFVMLLRQTAIKVLCSPWTFPRLPPHPKAGATSSSGTP